MPRTVTLGRLIVEGLILLAVNGAYLVDLGQACFSSRVGLGLVLVAGRYPIEYGIFWPPLSPPRTSCSTAALGVAASHAYIGRRFARERAGVSALCILVLLAIAGAFWPHAKPRIENPRSAPLSMKQS